MNADSALFLERLADPQVLLAVSPLLVVFGASIWAAVYSLAWCLRTSKPAKPVRATARPKEKSPIVLAVPPAPPPVVIDPGPELKARAEAADAKRVHSEAELTILSEKLSFANAQVEKEQELRRELETKTQRLATQFEEVIHEVEHIYHQNLGIAGFEELTQRIGKIRDGKPLEPRDPGFTPANVLPNKNPEKLLIAEQAGEIRKLKDVVAFYREKYGE